jgi:hypothetical protein
MRVPTRRPRSGTDEAQLGLPLAWLEPDQLIHALRLRGVNGIERVRYRPNRLRLISLSADHRSLNLHECFRGAPESVLDAIANFLRVPNGSAEQRAAVHVMRRWSEGQVPEDDGDPPRRRGSAGSPAQQRLLLEAYRRLNAHLFEGKLPDVIPLRLSRRMARRFGHVEYRRTRGTTREIGELAINLGLLIRGNERHFLDTLLHEMAHVEAWVLHGHRGHGAVWRRAARRVGCEVRALSWVRIRRRNIDPDHVPDVADLLERARRNAPAAWRPATGPPPDDAGPAGPPVASCG